LHFLSKSKMRQHL